jgi:hypothetical protein
LTSAPLPRTLPDQSDPNHWPGHAPLDGPVIGPEAPVLDDHRLR